jgi:hypothetical protein
MTSNTKLYIFIILLGILSVVLERSKKHQIVADSKPVVMELSFAGQTTPPVIDSGNGTVNAQVKVVPESLVYDLEIPEDFDPSIYCE